MKLLAIGVIAVVLAAGLLCWGCGDEGGDSSMAATVVVEQAGREYSGTLSLDEPSLQDQMMLSIGQDIRSTPLKFTGDDPGDDNGGVEFDMSTPFTVKVVVDYVIHGGEGIQGDDVDVTIRVSGYVMGDPNKVAMTENGEEVAVRSIVNEVGGYGASASDKFVSYAQPPNYQLHPLTGHQVDEMRLLVKIDVGSGGEVYDTVTAGIHLAVLCDGSVISFDGL